MPGTLRTPLEDEPDGRELPTPEPGEVEEVPPDRGAADPLDPPRGDAEPDLDDPAGAVRCGGLGAGALDTPPPLLADPPELDEPADPPPEEPAAEPDDPEDELPRWMGCAAVVAGAASASVVTTLSTRRVVRANGALPRSPVADLSR